MDAPLWTEWAYVAGVAISGMSPPLLWSFHAPLTQLTIRLGDFCLHCCLHKRTQGHPRAGTQTIASHEDLGPRLDDLFLYNADI